MESILELLLYRGNLLLKAVFLIVLLLLVLLWLRGLVSLPKLLFVLFDERWFEHVDAVLSVNLIGVVLQKDLIAGKLLLNGRQGYFGNRLVHLKCIQGIEQLFGYVEDIFGEEGPL